MRVVLTKDYDGWYHPPVGTVYEKKVGWTGYDGVKHNIEWVSDVRDKGGLCNFKMSQKNVDSYLRNGWMEHVVT